MKRNEKNNGDDPRDNEDFFEFQEEEMGTREENETIIQRFSNWLQREIALKMDVGLRETIENNLEKIDSEIQNFRRTLLYAVAPKTDDELKKAIEENKVLLDYPGATRSAQKWWDVFENGYASCLYAVWLLTVELRLRKATINDFFLAYIFSSTDNIQANLHYLDYCKLKKKEEQQKKEEEKKKEEKNQEKETQNN